MKTRTITWFTGGFEMKPIRIHASDGMPIMTRPIDETWTHDETEVRTANGWELLLRGPARSNGDREAEDAARARLAAQAPAMARLLTQLGAMDVHDAAGHTGVYQCSWCDGTSAALGDVTAEECTVAVRHREPCQLMAMLRAAGVVEP